MAHSARGLKFVMGERTWQQTEQVGSGSRRLAGHSASKLIKQEYEEEAELARELQGPPSVAIFKLPTV